ncbi:recombinase family protein [Kistimonas scapharcae]|uniref:Recombinase family protein n=1 Tax=Kistimonas scapharcae TaxID=1036133 RepID=A0ABP8V3P9_9GAMM
MKGQHVGYIRVSSLDQNTERQLDGATLDISFEDHCSGKDTKRPQLQACLNHLRSGDMLHVHSIDRLARNLKDLQTLVEDLTVRGVTIQFHKENLTFTGSENPMQRLMLQMMGAFAEFERSMIRERQREGIAAAKKRGKKMGASPKLSKHQVATVKKRIKAGESKKALAEEYGVSRQTIYNVLG